jgi:hypothetical protein
MHRVLDDVRCAPHRRLPRCSFRRPGEAQQRRLSRGVARSSFFIIIIIVGQKSQCASTKRR